MLLTFRQSDYRSLFIINGVLALQTAMLVPIYPLWIMEEMNTSVTTVFFLLSIIGVGTALLNMAVGHFADRLGQRKALVELTVLLGVLRTVLFAFFPNVWVLLIVSSLTQISNGGITFAILKERIQKHQHGHMEGLLTSTVRMSVSVGYIIGPAIGVFLASAFSFQMFFFISAFLYVILFFLSRVMLTEPAKKQPEHTEKTKTAKGQWMFVVLGFSLVILLFSGNIAVDTLLSVHIDRSYAPWVLAAVFAVSPLFELLAFPLAGWASDRFGLRITLLYGTIVGIVYFSIFFFFTSLPVLFLNQILGAVYTACLFTSLMLFIQQLFRHRLAFSSSMYFSAISLASILSNSLMGSALAGSQLTTGFLLLSGVTFVGLCLFGLMVFLETKTTALKEDKSAVS
ncbi:MFS transporter [Bacillaceae bacterium SIJ1]|uniref:MFS transporter n=1 Tax=Litoribacterium kuwaitense TaxID=1398745 RepID=UPI0013EBCD30|nr:MFS transporter [Litoribacterium kuwaitense]NGP45181.1 MFS transporter [Litoribacterium kuwaitense]